MKISATKQVILLFTLALVFGVLNNFRPNAQIEWVRDWQSFSELANKETVTMPDIVETNPDSAAPLSDDEIMAQVTEKIGSNFQITDIDLKTAKQFYNYAKDFTLWIDARSPELYEEGHVEGAMLCYINEKNTYLPEIEAQIAEKQPLALIIYCKGADCTDSHHLAEDLAGMGHENIFVYKDGFQTWYEAGLPIEGTLPQIEPPASVVGATPSDDEIMAQVTEQIGSNFQITDIDLKTAKQFYNYAKDFTLWIDARSPELYEEGHIEGALLCYINEKNSYLPEVEAQIAERQPLSLIIYCKGADCTDSHHLAEDLAGMGHENIFVYKDGFQVWYEAGLPIEGTLPAVALHSEPASGEPAPVIAAKAEEPEGMYLEHVLRDMIPFALGLVLLAFWSKARRSKAVTAFSSIFVGLFFIWAAFPKVMQPFAFAKSIWNYDLLPGPLINLSALGMPMLEMVAGLGLVFLVFRRGGGLVTGGLLVLFILAVSFNMLRGHEFNCGCTSNKLFLTEVFLEGWNEKILLILRDIGLLVMSALAFLNPKK